MKVGLDTYIYTNLDERRPRQKLFKKHGAIAISVPLGQYTELPQSAWLHVFAS